MLCKTCGIQYTGMKGVQRNRIDYGFCSIDCMSEDKEPCAQCGKKLVKYENEKVIHFYQRVFCNRSCAAVFNTLHRKPEHLAKIQKARSEFLATDEGKQSLEIFKVAFQDWRSANPDLVDQMVRKQTESRKERGVYERNGKRIREFFQTPEGEIRKEQYRSRLIGKPRPPHVTQKMKDSLRKFWDSDEGFKLRESFSEMYWNGVDTALWGPGWNQKAVFIRQRDTCCVTCGATQAEGYQNLDVHHIYPRRLFRYTPGKNRNYLWANHSSNLITLCKACHTKVEARSIPIPAEYQTNADLLWKEFLQEK